MSHLSLGFSRLPLRFNYVNPIAGTAVRTLCTWLTPSLIRSSYRYLYTILSIVVCRFFDSFSCHLRLERRLSITVCTTNVLRRAGVAGSARITLPALLATTKVSLNRTHRSSKLNWHDWSRRLLPFAEQQWALGESLARESESANKVYSAAALVSEIRECLCCECKDKCDLANRVKRALYWVVSLVVCILFIGFALLLWDIQKW